MRVTAVPMASSMFGEAEGQSQCIVASRPSATADASGDSIVARSGPSSAICRSPYQLVGPDEVGVRDHGSPVTCFARGGDRLLAVGDQSSGNPVVASTYSGVSPSMVRMRPLKYITGAGESRRSFFLVIENLPKWRREGDWGFIGAVCGQVFGP